jgi:hypothetical protein
MAQMRQKSYRDKGTTPQHFEVGDYVYLKVSPTKGVQSHRSMWASGLSYPITGTVFRSPQCVSCDPIKEGNACARKRSNHKS